MKRTPHLAALARSLADDGATAAQIARATGLALSTVLLWAAREHIALPSQSVALRKALADPKVRARKSEGARRAWATPASRARMLAGIKRVPEVAVPAWVPDDLLSEYLDVAAAGGEEAAASHCRRLKREMAAA
ncbi:MAG TPA: hypothetical protein VLA00_14760 [Xanthobacteraceae bacterium]|nr:hypothetical protein [Xanthobacteraceae bacterium]